MCAMQRPPTPLQDRSSTEMRRGLGIQRLLAPEDQRMRDDGAAAREGTRALRNCSTNSTRIVTRSRPPIACGDVWVGFVARRNIAGVPTARSN